MEKKLKETRPGLLRERDRLLAKLEKLDPVLGLELKTITAKLDVPVGLEGEYAHFTATRPFDAIVAYLTKAGEWSEPKQIARTLMDGGFRLDPINGHTYLIRTINYRVKTGKLQKAGELVGLLGWTPPTQ